MPKYRPEKSVKFTNMDGKEEEYVLEFGETLLNFECPLDKTYLVISHNPYDSIVICPKCGLDYDRRDLSPEGLQEQLKGHLELKEEGLKRLEKERSKLIKFLDFAEKEISRT